MKKLIVTLTATLACVAAFAQGKLQFSVDSLHLVYYNPNPGGLAPVDAALAGQAVWNSPSNTPAGVTLLVDLYGGTNANSLALISTTTFSSIAAGRWTAANTTFASLPAAVPAFFNIEVRDSRDPSAAAAEAAGHYFGFSGVFSAVPQPSSFNPIYQTIAPVNSTWPLGTYPMDYIAAGDKGSIMVGVIPEPTSFALAGLGAAALLIFRRRK